jgi:sulfur carrier protein ThiS
MIFYAFFIFTASRGYRVLTDAEAEFEDRIAELEARELEMASKLERDVLHGHQYLTKDRDEEDVVRIHYLAI